MSIIACMSPRELLVKLRRRKGWSQEELAKQAGVAKGTIGGIEAENEWPATWEILDKIAVALGVTIDYLLRATGAIAPHEKHVDKTIAKMLDIAEDLPEEDADEALRILEVIRETTRRRNR